jgi:hypothetical protein
MEKDIMNKNYETPSIEIIEYESDIHTANSSTIFDFPWLDGNEGESDFFE